MVVNAAKGMHDIPAEFLDVTCCTVALCCWQRSNRHRSSLHSWMRTDRTSVHVQLWSELLCLFELCYRHEITIRQQSLWISTDDYAITRFMRPQSFPVHSEVQEEAAIIILFAMHHDLLQVVTDVYSRCMQCFFA